MPPTTILVFSFLYVVTLGLLKVTFDLDEGLLCLFVCVCIFRTRV